MLLRILTRSWPVVAALLGAASVAQAQWTVTNLHPVGSLESKANGGFGSQQVGVSDSLACAWSGTAASKVDLHPGGAVTSLAGAAGAGEQAGRAQVAAGLVASLWSGSSASWVDLHPSGKISSEAFAVSGGVQVGWAMMPSTFETHASMWSGSAGSWVDLHPHPSWAGSYAYGVSGTQVAGAVITTLLDSRACLWRLPDLLWVDLSANQSSYASATDGSHQAGSFYTPGPSGVSHACVWTGTSASKVDLHPGVAFDSDALGISDGQQVGWVRIGGLHRAALWSGTAASFVDLHTFLPAAFGSSRAQAIWNDAGKTFVAGFGSNTVTGRTEALLWSRAAPTWTDLGFGLAGVSGEPGLLGTGTLVGGSPGSLALSSAKPSSPGLLFVSLVGAPVPFKGGVLKAFPIALLVNLATNAVGAFTLPFTWPTGIPSATTIYFQCAIQDPAGPQGASLSHALKAVTP